MPARIDRLRRRSFILASILPFVGGRRAVALDQIDLPAPLREFRSPSGNFVLSVSVAGKSPTATAELSGLSGSNRTSLWRRPLPQSFGPRFVLVTDNGAVVLFDEWINTPSPHALMLIGADNKVLADYSFDQLVERLGVARRDITTYAKLGPWLSDTPLLRDDGRTVQMQAAGRMLTLSTADGALSVAQ